MARRRILAALGLVLAAAVFLPPQLARVQLSADPYVFNDDARQWTVPFLGGALRDDWTSRYYRTITPIGVRALNAFDAEAVSKVLPFVLFAATCALVAMTVFAITRNFAAATLAVCFLFSTPALMARMTGGSSRAFAFPILAALAYALVTDRVRLAAIVTVLGAACYPPAGVLAGAALVLVECGDASRRFRQRQLALPHSMAAAVLSLLVMLPMLIGTRAYGRAVSAADVATFPEAGPHGRYSPEDRAPFPNVFDATYRALDWGLRPGGARLVPPALQGQAIARAIVLIAAGIGVFVFARRLLILPAAALLMYVAAAMLFPRLYLPTRYVVYGLVLLPAIAIPVAAFATTRRGIAIAACTAILLLLGGRGSGTTGFSVNAHPAAPLYETIARIPNAKLIAGWPAGPIDNVPYLSHKPALLTFETHQALHAGAIETQRARMLALIDAYFATSPAPLVRLRDAFGVTHLIVDKRHFTERPPRYFAPFDVAIGKAIQKLNGHVPEVSRHAPLFAFGPYIVLDLREVR